MAGIIIFVLIIVYAYYKNSAVKKDSSTAEKTDSQPSAPSKPASPGASRPASPTASRPAAKPTAPRPSRPAPSAAPTRPAAPRPAPAADNAPKYYDSTCMTQSSKHDHDRRLEQLKDFLKAGIISREEYRILLDKYSKYQ